MKRAVLMSLILAVALPVAAQKKPMIYSSADMKWGPAPPSLPKGVQAMVLEGDPREEGIFTIRFKLAPGFRLPPHWHPAYEHVTVISGSYFVGHGEKFDEKAMKQLGPGGFSVMPNRIPHYTMSKDGAIVQVHAMGPWEVIYLNPADDPRNKK